MLLWWFWCGRASIGTVTDEQWNGCVAEETPIIDPVPPIDESGDIAYTKEMKDLDKEIKDATSMIRYYIAQKMRKKQGKKQNSCWLNE